MKIHEIKYFMMLAEQLNFSSAAAKLYISQSSLSKTISSLEQELGFKLLTRSTRKVELTEKGRRFYEISNEFVKQCDLLLLDSDEEASDTLRGQLVLACEKAGDYSYLPFIIEAFSQKYPSVTLKIKKQRIENLIQDLREKKTDLGIVPSFAIPPDGFRYKLLFPYKLQVLIWKDHPYSKRRHVKLKDLEDETFVILDPQVSRSSETILHLFSNLGFPLKEVVYAANYRQMFLMTAQREGISFNLTMTNAAEYWDLISLEVDLSHYRNEYSEIGIAMAWNHQNNNPAINSFLKTLEMPTFSSFKATMLLDE